MCGLNRLPIDGDEMVIGKINTLFNLAKMIILWLGMPLLLSTIGESMRWLVTLRYKRVKEIEIELEPDGK